MQGSPSLTTGVVGGFFFAFVLVVVPVVFSSQYSRPHILATHFLSCTMSIGGSALSLLVRDNVTTHPSLRLYKPQSCFLESDPMIIARFQKAVLYNRSTSPLVSVYMCLSNKCQHLPYTLYILAVTAERTLFNLLLLWIFILILE